jgi:hypothetical protein
LKLLGCPLVPLILYMFTGWLPCPLGDVDVPYSRRIKLAEMSRLYVTTILTGPHGLPLTVPYYQMIIVAEGARITLPLRLCPCLLCLRRGPQPRSLAPCRRPPPAQMVRTQGTRHRA